MHAHRLSSFARPAPDFFAAVLLCKFQNRDHAKTDNAGIPGFTEPGSGQKRVQQSASIPGSLRGKANTTHVGFPKRLRLPSAEIARFGFGALPAGNRNGNGTFNNVQSNANFWSSTENSANNAYNRNLNYNGTDLNTNNNKNNARSVRCVKDSLAELSGSALFSEVYRAYLDARRHKRNTKSQLEFESNLEPNLLRLARDHERREYELSPSVCFIYEGKVKREVIAAAFRDRVVHHLLWNWTCPLFERSFIYDSYSCRKGKGTLFGIRRASGFLRAASDDFRKDCWALRLDISGFFMNIDRRILFSLVKETLDRYAYEGVPSKDLCLYLLQKVIFDNPLERAVFRSPMSAWDGLPQNKTLRHARPFCGLPIGNLTSQLFGNVYLNPLDQFVKRTLKVRHYGRYVDDMVLVHSDREFLLGCIPKIRAFLTERLRLRLHPKKIYLQPALRGFPFLGAFVLPYRTYLGRSFWKSFRACLERPFADASLQFARETSYLGLFKTFYPGKFSKIFPFGRKNGEVPLQKSAIFSIFGNPQQT